MKNILLKYIIDPLIIKFGSRARFLNLQALQQKKIQLLESFQSIGESVKLNGEKFTFSCPQNIILGNNIHIGDNAYFNARGGLIIGDNTHISRNVSIYTVNHNYTGVVLPYDNDEVHKPVFIGKNVWIGMNVSIVPGVTIGDGAIIGMGTVVNSDVEPMEIIGSTNFRKLKERNLDHYTVLNSSNKFGGSSGKVLTDDDVKRFKKTYSENRHQPIVFVLGTGRSGSTSIAKTLNQHSNCHAFHEDIYQLIRLSSWYENQGKKEKALKELERIFENKIWQADNEELIIHSDQKLWNFIPFLSEYFPNAKFIHLVRNPYDSVVSMASRNWYKENEYFEYNSNHWAKYRLQADRIGEIDEDVWANMSSLAKCTWYWYYINENIENALNSLSEERVLKVNLKDLSKEMNVIGEFLQLEGFDLQLLKTNKRNSLHDKNYKDLSLSNVREQIDDELSKYKISFSY